MLKFGNFIHKKSVMNDKCPLTNKQVNDVIGTLKSKNQLFDFDTFDFIDNCILGVKRCNVLIKAGNKIPCGRRLGLYRTETNLIIDQNQNSGSRGRKWLKSNNFHSDIDYNKKKNIEKSTYLTNFNHKHIPPVTLGHKKALKWYESENFKKMKENYDDAFGNNNVYFRIVDTGVTAISLDLDCPSFLGINSNRENQSCYIKTNSTALPKNNYNLLKTNFDLHKRTIKRISSEEKTVIRFIKYSFDNNLSLMNFPDGYYFLNNEWRFIDNQKKGRKSDIIGVNINNDCLIIIEFKSSRSKRNEAIKQVKEYSSFYLKYKKAYDKFFKAQFNAINKLYNKDILINCEIQFTLNPELYIGYPEYGEIIIERVI